MEVAGLADRVVAAHCHGKPGIMAALEAGARTIEHGTYLDDEACDAMKETGAILVPTRSIIEDILANLAAVPGYAAAKLVRDGAGARRRDDAGHRARGHHRDGDGYRPDGHGPAQFMGHKRIGARASGDARHDSVAGHRGRDRDGAADARAAGPAQRQAQAGYDADVITLDGDPLADISVLASPAHVTGVWVAGRQVKGEAAG